MAPLPNVAAVEQIRTSEARHSAKPAPTQGPFTAAITGCGKFQIACGSAAIASWNRSRSMAGSEASTVLAAKFRTSMPEQNPRPAPVMTTASTVTSVPIAASVWVSSSHMTSLIALSCFGRLSCSTTTPGCGLPTISVSVTAVSAGAVRAPGWR
jgi:hypothetical protein